MCYKVYGVVLNYKMGKNTNIILCQANASMRCVLV